MTSLQDRVKTKLVERVKQAAGPERAAAFVGGTHTEHLEDNLLPGLTAAQVETLRGQLARGGGGELTATKSGKRSAHAPYSSAVLALNAFGRWLGCESQLSIAGLTGFTEPLRVEGKQKIHHGGGTANLDVLLTGDELVAGVESKLTETFSTHQPVAWKESYKSEKLRALLDPQWSGLLDDSIAGTWAPRRLAGEQLIKHVLGLVSQNPNLERHLVYVFWEPVNAEDVESVTEHRAEVAELRERVAGASTQLHALSYTELLDEWAALDGPVWLGKHLEQLTQRYAFVI